jgi:ribosomal protein S18 acetylase RimI-like enzyme
MTKVTLRAARRGDASDMAVLVDIAGYGLPSHYWSAAVKRGEAISALEAGRMRALRAEGLFSYRNAVIAEVAGEVAGMLLGYRQPDAMTAETGPEADAVLRPLVELEALAPGTWYVNVLATFAEYRGRGVGRALLDRAEEIAAQTLARGLSLIVEDDNAGARRLYTAKGYVETATRPFHRFPGCHPAENWILMVKQL